MDSARLDPGPLEKAFIPSRVEKPRGAASSAVEDKNLPHVDGKHPQAVLGTATDA
jgi:hypothetical protein